MSNDRVRFELVALNGPLIGARLPLRLGENVLGRDDWVDLPVVAGSVSRRHAVLRLRPGGQVEVADLASRNGTRVNGVRVSDEAPMTVYDVLEVGEVGLQMVPAGHAASTPAPPASPARPVPGPLGAVDDVQVPGVEHNAPTGLLPRVPADPHGPGARSPHGAGAGAAGRGPSTPPNGFASAAGSEALSSSLFPVRDRSASARAGQRPGAARQGRAGPAWPTVLGALAVLVGLVLLVAGVGAGMVVRLALVALVAAGLVLVVRGRRSP